MSVTSPESSGFTPRREFLRDNIAHVPSSFSLLAFAGANSLKLFSFPLPVLTAIRRLLDHLELVTNVREDITNQVCEYSLGGRPWASPKSTHTERVIVQILAVIYEHGYQYLSTIDYGREADDKLALAFARPVPRVPASLSPVESPIPTSISSNRQGRRIPFALSFTSQTTLRVIAPPLHSTPAILQAVRGAWPRGVVGEKKVADNCFEFKLKGYKWFHEDTFAADSLRHILALLSSLDAHSFSLVASISLTGRSRVKDLWVFTGPSSSVDSLPDSPAPSILNGSNADFRRVATATSQMANSPSGQSQQSLHHRRLATDPSPSTTVPLAQASHNRSATESPPNASSRAAAARQSLLRKPAPRAQVPISVHDTDNPMPEPEPLRAQLSSSSGEQFDNRTRAPDVLYTSPSLQNSPPKEEPFPLLLPKADSRSQTPSSHGKRSSGDAVPSLGSGSHSPSPLPSPPLVVTPPLEDLHDSPAETPPILSPNAFRDSTLSSATDSTYDMPIPIKWTGLGRDSSLDERESMGPTLPGGWQPTPIDEKPEDLEESFQDSLLTPDIQEVPVRVNSPEPQSPDLELRKSEAGLVGLIAASESSKPTNEGKGWVVVDVEGEGEDKVVASPPALSPTPPKAASAPSETPGSSGANTPTPISPAAKAIAIVDAIESKNNNKSTPASLASSKAKSPEGGVKKFFSLGRKNSTTATPSQQPPPSPIPNKAGVSENDTKRAIELVRDASDASKMNQKKKNTKPSLRQRLRLAGTPEASRNEDKRRSLN
ncbi:hypothetical protein MIND_00464900 [Mycena indigotica]|uniref:Uncharacterized protein n=1 Tax=Mycena indigotica TaxID=2126181 RepID=A0A8H6SYN9_9AGAR|nr:uncharacterized protein MIND_00464900 [Mycena indigotica]KAF7306732.1 hypothetical protein MIND_00464900 [Mycena indigotica]